MCIPAAPKLPQPAPFVPPPPPLAPPPASATAATIGDRSAAAIAPAASRLMKKNPLRTDQGSTDSVASGLNIPV